MREKQVAKNQLINESTKQRQRFAKWEKSETRHKQAEKALNKREELYLHTQSRDKIKDLKPGDHLCCLYRTEEEHRSLFTPFLRQGLEQHEKVVYIVATHTAKDILDYLRDDGVKVETYLASGQLSILAAHETYLRDGFFDPDRMITLLKTETERALAEGYSTLRLTGEMSWALRGVSGSEKLIEYEAKLNKFLPGSKCLAICQYDCTQFNPKLILDVIATHPIVVLGTEAYDNFYYMSPKDFLGPDRDEAMLQNWITNLADRNQMEEALHESEERFRHIFEQSPLGICIESLDGKIVACNKIVEATTGYSFNELKKMNLADLYENKEDKEALLKVIKRKGRVADYQVRLKHKDGTPYDALFSISKINLGGVDFLHTICQDITERKQVEHALSESEKKYKQLTESISDVFFEMDKDLLCTYWNRASEKLTGISAKDAIGKSLLELFPDILLTRKTKKVYLDVLRTQQPQTFINEYMFGGEGFFFDISVYPSKRGLSVFAKDITERMKTEEELREKEEFNFALFQHNPIQTIVVDRGGRVLKVNLAKRKSGDKLPNIGDVMYKDYAAKHEIDMHAEMIECIRSNKKKRFPSLKYGYKFLDITIASFPDGAIITSLDITERKRAEEELEDIFLLSPDMIAVCTTEGKFLKVNPAWEKVLDYTTKEVIDLGWAKLVHPDDIEQTNKEVEKQLKGSPTVNFINRFKCKDGSYKLLEWQATDAKEGIVYATARDITEREKIEEELKESEARWRSLTENSPDHIMLLDRNANILYINRTVPDLTKEDVIGNSVYNYHPPEFRKVASDCFKRVLKTGKSDIYYTEYQTKEGETRYFESRVGPILESGKIVSLISSATDITKRRRTEEELGASEGRYRSLFDNMLEGFAYCKIIVDENNKPVDFEYIEVSEAFEKLTGLKKEQVTGKRVTETIPSIKKRNP